MGMSIQVNDFRWEPGKNDAEYIKLLESSRDEWQKIAQKAIAKLKALSKAQEPRLVTIDDFEGADEYGWLPAWCEQQMDGAVYCECILADALKEKGIRYWTSRPTYEQREKVKWE